LSIEASKSLKDNAIPEKRQTGRKSCTRSLPGVSRGVRSLPRLWLGGDAGPGSLSWPGLEGDHDGGALVSQFMLFEKRIATSEGNRWELALFVYDI
jgi:hypothetical protein